HTRFRPFTNLILIEHPNLSALTVSYVLELRQAILTRNDELFLGSTAAVRCCRPQRRRRRNRKRTRVRRDPKGIQQRCSPPVVTSQQWCRTSGRSPPANV